MTCNQRSFNSALPQSLVAIALAFSLGCAPEPMADFDTLNFESTPSTAAYAPASPDSLTQVEPTTQPSEGSGDNAQPQTYAIDLPTALRLGQGQNQLVQLMQERITEANANLDQAQLLLLPNLRLGAGYQHHEGRIQSTNGSVIEASRSSGNIGPSINLTLDIADAIYQPLAAKQDAAAATAASQAVSNHVLLEVTNAYYELLRATLNLEIAQETLANNTDLAQLTTNFARSGAGLESDAARAAVEQLIAQQRLDQANETVNVNSARLAQLLHLDPTIRLQPNDTAVASINIVSTDTPLTELISTAQTRRPEVEQNNALVEGGLQRYKQAKKGPWIPNLTAGVGGGLFGGGTGSSLGNSDDRSDYGVGIYWQLDNLGLGDKARQRQQRSRLQQLRLSKSATLDQISSEVAQAYAQVQAAPHQIELGTAAVKRAVTSYELNRSRIYQKQGLPIETLQAIQSLTLTRQIYLNSVINNNQAQFRLYTAIGHPPIAFENN